MSELAAGEPSAPLAEPSQQQSPSAAAYRYEVDHSDLVDTSTDGGGYDQDEGVPADDDYTTRKSSPSCSCRACLRRCGGVCFCCFARLGDCTAACGKKISPKTIKGAKQCTCCSIFMLLLAIGLFVQAFILPTLLHKDLVTGLQKAVLLDDPTTPEFQKWTDNSDNPLTLTAYVYHITNPQGMLNGEQPQLVEMGPYVYHQYQLQYDLAFGSNMSYYGPNNTHRILSYRTYTWYEFVPELSIGDEMMDNLTTLNMPFISLRAFYISQGMETSLNDLFTKFSIYKGSTEAQRLFTNKSVHETLFGWQDPIISLLQQTYRGYIKNYPSFNASLLDPFNANYMNTIYTGALDTFPQIRNYLMWHNQSYIATCAPPKVTDMCDLVDEVPAYNNATDGPPGPTGQPTDVAQLRGNDGSVFPTPINEQSTLTTYFSPLIRSVDLQYKQASTYKGVPLLRFGFPDFFFSNAETYPPNAAYSQFGPNGLINVSVVQGGIPLFVSNPRFKNADASLSNAVNVAYLGPVNEATLPSTMYEIEPESGVTFHVLTSSQVNLFINPLPNMPINPETNSTTWFANLTAVYLPVMWAQEEGGIDNDDAATISEVLDIITISQTGGLALGVFFAVMSCLYGFLSWRTYDIETDKHLSAVRSLLTDGDSTAGVGVIDGGSLLDSSILMMQDDIDEREPGRPIRESEAVDITYKYAAGPAPRKQSMNGRGMSDGTQSMSREGEGSYQSM